VKCYYEKQEYTVLKMDNRTVLIDKPTSIEVYDGRRFVQKPVPISWVSRDKICFADPMFWLGRDGDSEEG